MLRLAAAAVVLLVASCGAFAADKSLERAFDDYLKRNDPDHGVLLAGMQVEDPALRAKAVAAAAADPVWPGGYHLIPPERVFRHLLFDPDPGVRKAALPILSKLGETAEEVEPLFLLLTEQSSPAAREAMERRHSQLLFRDLKAEPTLDLRISIWDFSPDGAGASPGPDAGQPKRPVSSAELDLIENLSAVFSLDPGPSIHPHVLALRKLKRRIWERALRRAIKRKKSSAGRLAVIVETLQFGWYVDTQIAPKRAEYVNRLWKRKRVRDTFQWLSRGGKPDDAPRLRSQVSSGVTSPRSNVSSGVTSSRFKTASGKASPRHGTQQDDQVFPPYPDRDGGGYEKISPKQLRQYVVPMLNDPDAGIRGVARMILTQRGDDSQFLLARLSGAVREADASPQEVVQLISRVNARQKPAVALVRQLFARAVSPQVRLELLDFTKRMKLKDRDTQRFLLECLTDRRRFVNLSAAVAVKRLDLLKELQENDVLPGLQSSRTDDVLRAAAQLQALGRDANVGGKELRRLATHPDERVRLRAIAALSRMRGPQPDLLQPLTGLLQSKVADRRLEALRSITSLGRDARPAVPAVVKALQDADDRLADEALQVLKNLQSLDEDDRGR